ncbi:hypothetical protein KDW_38990 [Dictyobacter vulcani]|uniref:Uncharacterized protein n=1 Tax=Dictyobacter vulcani TaxID=2607529 RepID=A0A5J4KTI8_9CHLR|nr:hypothetical protein KDW_38990 [Dictyobacter vulcani]
MFLFDSSALFKALQSRGVKFVFVATSIASTIYLASEVYPIQRNQQLLVTEGQKKQLDLFNDKNSG